LDSADAYALNGSDLDVALITPACSPRVSDDPVVLTSIATIADNNDGVIGGGSTLVGVKDTAGVHLEDGLVGLNTDSNWLLGDSSLKLCNVVWSNHEGISNGDLSQ